MEQDEDYKHIISTINELEMKINILDGDALEQVRFATYNLFIYKTLFN